MLKHKRIVRVHTHTQGVRKSFMAIIQQDFDFRNGMDNFGLVMLKHQIILLDLA